MSRLVHGYRRIASARSSLQTAILQAPSDVLENSIYLDVEGQGPHHRQESEVFSRVVMTITSVITSKKRPTIIRFKAEQRKVPGTKMFVPCHCLFREV